MKDKNISVYSERTNLRVYLLTLVIMIVGICLLLLANNISFLDKKPIIKGIINNVGSFFIASIAIALIWDLFAKRAFLAELISETKLAEEIRNSGLVSTTYRWKDGLNWSDVFRTSKKIDIFFIYGSTWRNLYHTELEKFVSRKNTEIRIVLSDPFNSELMNEVGKRSNMTSNDIKKKIIEASDDFVNIFNKFSINCNNCSLWYLSISPVYSLYRFDNLIQITICKHRTERFDIPTFVFKKRGTGFKFFHDEFASFVESNSPLARKIYPCQSNE